MAKNLKLLLVAFSTVRVVDGAERRVRFDAKKVVELTDEELETLDKLTAATGKLHYRDPISEGGAKVVASEPEVVDVPDYAGQSVAMDEKSVDMLKAYLTFHEVEFKGNASKADLLAAAKAHEVEATKADDADPDAGL